jgi:DNA-binding CsgD family transcriptional regulator
MSHSLPRSRGAAGRADLLDIIESAYVVDGSDVAWLERIAESVQASLPFPSVGVVVNAYDVSVLDRPVFGRFHFAASDGAARLARSWRELVRIFEADPERTRASYGALDEGLGLEIPAPNGEALAAAFRRIGIGDVYGVNGRNPSGKGCFIGICMPPSFAPLNPSMRHTFARIARHVAAGYRLRERLAKAEAARDRMERADAVLGLDGRVEHAVGEAREADARDALRRSVVAIAASRRERREDPERAIARWKALVDARWSLVDHFERDGRRYLLAQRNDCETAPLALLTERERQVAALAAMGHANKVIAYELGIATSTVGVLVSRALRRLGLRSRRELRALTRPRLP